jgi:adenosylhomocysteine nucleosidase
MRILVLTVMALVALWTAPPTPAGTLPTAAGYTAVLCAFEPEWKALVGLVKHPQTRSFAGMRLVSGMLEDQPVLLMMSDIGMVNAALNTQLLIDHYRIKRIVFSGIAGGLDPALSIGDVIVPERWVESMEMVMARATPEGFKAPDWMPGMVSVPGYGMMLPRGVRVGSAHHEDDYHDDFSVDPGLLAVARNALGELALKNCTGSHVCLDKVPKVVIGGVGLTSPAFVDNKEYREYLHTTFHASVTDNESAAVAQVAFHNEIPFIIFRSVSDLAGGDASTNQMRTFMQLAADNSASVVTAFIRALH